MSVRTGYGRSVLIKSDRWASVLTNGQKGVLVSGEETKEELVGLVRAEVKKEAARRK